MGISIINNYSFLIVGGNNERILAEVEEYNVSSNTWTKKDKLNIARYGSGICGFSWKYIYVFGGATVEDGKEKMVMQIERCDTMKANLEWSLIPLYKSEWKGGIDFGCFQNSQSKIIICGGYEFSSINEGENNSVKDIYVYDDANGSILKSGELNRKELFTSNFYYGNSREVYGFGMSGVVYCYNLDVYTWTDFIPQ